jgi:predicted nucleic acid-binding protein
VILVDSNVLIDISGDDGHWADWSRANLNDAAMQGRILLNQIIVAEVAPIFASLDAFVAWMSPLQPDYVDLTNEAAFAGGRAFREHRSRRRADMATIKSVLPDFLIGGHAQSLGATILTRDPRFYRSYFADVPLICPTKDDHD